MPVAIGTLFRKCENAAQEESAINYKDEGKIEKQRSNIHPQISDIESGANSQDPDKTPQSTVSYQGLHFSVLASPIPPLIC